MILHMQMELLLWKIMSLTWKLSQISIWQRKLILLTEKYITTAVNVARLAQKHLKQENLFRHIQSHLMPMAEV